MIDPEKLAKSFHEHHQRLAPAFGVKLKQRCSWADLPKAQKSLLVAVFTTILNEAPDLDRAVGEEETLP